MIKIYVILSYLAVVLNIYIAWIETETAYLALIILTRSSKLNWPFFMLTNSQKNVFWAKLKQELWMLPSRPSSSKGYYECCSKSSEIQRMDRWWWKILEEHLGNLCTALHSVLDDDYDEWGVRWYGRWVTLVGQVVGRQDWPCKVHIFCDYLWSLPLKYPLEGNFKILKVCLFISKSIIFNPAK